MLRSGLRYGVCLLAAVSSALLFTSAIAPGPASAATLPSNCVPSGATVTCTFSYNGTTGADGTAQLFTVPAGVSQVTLDAWGAQGEGPPSTFPGLGTFAGGLGGHARGAFAVAPGSALFVLVGGKGGFNGGGAGSFAGGGASDVRLGSTALGARMIVAGGGGGEGHARFLAPDLDVSFGLPGGAGGGPVGGAGVCDFLLPTGSTFHVDGCGAAGSAIAGGSGGTSSPSCASPTIVAAEPGAAGLAGAGAEVSCQQPLFLATTGAGGGGGFFGGGGGGADVGIFPLTSIGGAGGGGSGFVRSGASDVVDESGVRGGNGLVVISYPRTPPSKDACKNGGWHDYVDDHGRPFANQGQCVAWAVHHVH